MNKRFRGPLQSLRRHTRFGGRLVVSGTGAGECLENRDVLLRGWNLAQPLGDAAT
jgi:hypothetical protein